ncbi:MAG: hypothetical protein U0903_07725 [Planctomycetales bacterium]
MNSRGTTEQGSEDASSQQERLLSECRSILEAWAELEQSRRSLSARLFAAGENQEQIQDLLDQVERRSEQLLFATRELLARSGMK